MKSEDEYTRQISFDKDKGNGRPEQSTEVKAADAIGCHLNQRERVKFC